MCTLRTAVVLVLMFLIPGPAAESAGIGYLALPGTLSHEDSAAIALLRGGGYAVRILDPTNARLDAPGVDLVWVHIPDSAAHERWRPHLAKLRPLGSYVRGGGKLLATGFGAMAPYLIGIESVEPEVKPLQITNDWLWDQKGLQGFRGHPVYAGFFGGVFTWDTGTDHLLHRIGYFEDRFPKEGRVVGIEKSYVILESDNKLMIEYASGRGRAMAIGAFVFPGRPNSKEPHLYRFLGNTVDYLLRGGEGATYWLQARNVPRQFAASTGALTGKRSGKLERLPESGLVLTRSAPRDNFYDVAGRRALVMGRENGGIDELWVHPFRVLRDLQAGLVRGDSIQWLRNLPVSVEVRPESFTRIYSTPHGRLREIVFASLTRAGALVQYALEDPGARARLMVRYRCDQRWMWPYDERALGDVYYGYDRGVLHVRDVSSDFYCMIGAGREPLQHLTGHLDSLWWSGGELHGDTTTANQVYHGAVYPLGGEAGATLTMALVGTDEGKMKAAVDFEELLRRPADEYAQAVRHYRRLLDRSVTVATPDPEFNTLWKWTLVGTDRFVTTTPRLGTALVAGFSTVNRGWNGGHKISGRPGYAWYFGRDSEWSGFAVDDYGDFGTVRQQLEFLQRYQDMTGKIFHELSTSGVVHYDASDATPLYIILAAHYLRASGDREFIRKSWPHIRKAMEFMYTTDSDGDLLIEDTNIGHGWVEGGKLWPVHTEFYLAGIWGQALADASWMAELVGQEDLAGRYGRDAETVQKRVDTDFFNDSTGSYSYGKLMDGSYNPEPTVLPAPVMYYGWLDDRKVLPILARYASHSFSSDWGVRIVAEESKLFSPQGYHYGSIWPLFTGWTALAEYVYGNSGQGFSHILNNMYIKNHWALGYVEEVMRGDVYTAGGICPHQCWSETNILHPGIHGMIGWSPRATDGAARLSPRFPVHWDSVGVRNLRAGRSVLDLTMERSSRFTTYRLALREGPPLTIELAPEFMAGTDVIRATIDGRAVPFAAARNRGLLARPVRVRLTGKADVHFTHAGGVGVVPVVPRPEPGDSTRALKIIGARLDGLLYTLDLEGRSGTTAEVELVLMDQQVLGVEGGTLLGERSPGRAVLRVPFGPSPERYHRKQVTVRLREVQR